MSSIFDVQNIKLNVSCESKEEAIQMAGNILMTRGYVDQAYLPSMMEREEMASTYMGNFVAIPHGTDESKKSVLTSGLSLLQIPEGVSFGPDKPVKLVIGIAGKNGEHMDILQQIAIVCSDQDNVDRIVNAETPEEIIAIFSEVTD
jgi:PTS system mannitol-specific IIA component